MGVVRGWEVKFPPCRGKRDKDGAPSGVGMSERVGQPPLTSPGSSRSRGWRCRLYKLRAGPVHMRNHLRAAQAGFDAFLTPPHAIRAQHARRRAGYNGGDQPNQPGGEATSTFAKVTAAVRSAGSGHTKHFLRIDWGGGLRDFGRQRNEPIQVRRARLCGRTLDYSEYRSAFRVGLRAGTERFGVFLQTFHKNMSRAVAGRHHRLTPCKSIRSTPYGGKPWSFQHWNAVRNIFLSKVPGQPAAGMLPLLTAL